MTDEILPPDPDEDLDEDDGENEPIEGDVTETDVEDEPPVKSGEIPAEAF